MEKLEELDNKSLRAKCMEYGLPNIPITDTSRKLLIRKLHALMQAQNIEDTKQNKSRRQTIHLTVTKPDETTTVEERRREKSKSPSRRKTINITSDKTLKTSESTTTTTSSSSATKRRSGRITPNVSVPQNATNEVKTKMDKSIIVEEDDDVIVINDDKIGTRSPSRQSRASSLSKSPVTIITYAKEHKEPILEDDEDVEETTTYTYKSALSRNENSEYRNDHLFGTSQYTAGMGTYSHNTNPLLPSSSLLSRRTLDSYSTRPTVGASSVNAREIGRTSYGGNIDSHRVTSSYLTREDSGDDDPIINQSPYLSEFTRKLSRLKTESFPNDGVAPRRTTLLHQRDYRPLRSSDYDRKNESIGESLQQLWIALDRKYKLKRRFFYLAMIILVVVCIYFLLH